TELNNNSMVSHVFNSTDSTVRSTLTFGGVAFTADTAKITTITSPYTIENIENGLGILVEELESFLDFGKNPDNDYLDDFSYASTEAIKIPIVNNQRIDKIVNIAAGGNGTIALRNDGSLYVWGDTTYKQLVIPPHPTGSATITSLARGENHSMILTSQGQVISWGDNSYGQTTVPLTASTNIVAIAAGRYHSLALSATGNIIAWGNNNLGQTNVDTSRRYKAISAGENFSLAIDTQGNLHRWGTAVHNRTVNTQRNRYHQFLSSGYSHAFTVDTLKYINGLGSNVFKQLSIPTYLLNSYTWFVAAGANRSIALSSKRHQYITFTISNKTYGDIPFVLNATSTSALEVSYSVSNTLISLNNNTVSIHGAGTVAITAYQTGNESYLSSPSVTQVLIIYKAGQSISFPELGQKTYGDAPFLLYASATSTLEATYSASNTLISFNNNTVSIHGAGTVAITAYQTGNDNYLSTSETQVLTIDKAVQSISFPALAQKKYEDAPFLLYASATSTLEVTYSVSNTLISLNNNTVSIHGAGTVEIT
ncbi:MAG: hypothetical protein QM536_00875, partial [Chitinophagaceae bacterium]|nr:hypothetical protein [Chitinophagaceae bacterium]